jgi:hypothetical protein
MPYCSNCGKEVTENSSFCGHCGKKLGNVQNNFQQSTMLSAITDKDFSTFIGKNASRYVAKFKKFNMGELDNFAPTWHWPAFFVPFIWLLYRKLYLWALLIFCLSIIPFVGFIVMIVMGITANYLYYRHAKKKILALKSLFKSSESQAAIEIARTGGVNNVAPWIIGAILLIAIIGIIAAILVPQFSTYLKQEKSKKWENYKGGIHFVIKVESEGNATLDNENTITIAKIIEKKLETLGCKNKIIKIQGDREIVIQLQIGRASCRERVY